jgi:hypothetical protein
VYPLIRIYYRVISWWFHKRLPFALSEFVYRWFWASTLHGVDPLSSHVIMISLVPSVYPSYSIIQESANSVWKSYPDRGYCPWRWNLREREREFFSSLSIRPSWIKKTSNEAQQAESWSVTRFYNGAMSPTHGRKSFMRDREVFLLPNYPDDLLSPRSMCPSSFLVLPTPHRKSQDDISFKGGGQQHPMLWFS